MAARKLRRHAGEHDLIEAFDQPGCPVCRLVTESVDAYLTAVCYEQVNDLDLREQLRSRGGFCRAHAERFLRQRLGQLASAIVYRDVLSTARKRIAASVGQRARSKLAGVLGGRRGRGGVGGGGRGMGGGGGGGARWRGGVWRGGEGGRGETVGGPRCRGGGVEGAAARRYLEILHKRLPEQAILDQYRAGDGLCLPHLDQ